MEQPLGRQLGKYQILEELGWGGMAVVYKGYDPSLERLVAIKSILPHLARDQEFVHRFLREARAVAKLSHPNIITIYEVGQADNAYYYVMEYLPGRSLTEILKERGALPVEQALDITEQIASALDYAHKHGLVHRDVKSANILMNEEGRAILTDFGIVWSSGSTRYTSAGMAVGTPEYMSPEQALGQEPTPASDLYSLAIITYEMLTGDVPFRSTTPLALLRMQADDPPPPPRQRNPRISTAVEQVLLWALRKAPNERPSSCTAFAQALKEAAAGRAPKKTPAPVRPVTPPRQQAVKPGLGRRPTPPRQDATPFRADEVPQEIARTQLAEAAISPPQRQSTPSQQAGFPPGRGEGQGRAVPGAQGSVSRPVPLYRRMGARVGGAILLAISLFALFLWLGIRPGGPLSSTSRRPTSRPTAKSTARPELPTQVTLPASESSPRGSVLPTPSLLPTGVPASPGISPSIMPSQPTTTPLPTTAVPLVRPTATPQPATAVPEPPTATPQPTSTPPPTATEAEPTRERPTNTPEPTMAPPTDTPEPTPVPPTEEPTPTWTPPIIPEPTPTWTPPVPGAVQP